MHPCEQENVTEDHKGLTSGAEFVLVAEAFTNSCLKSRKQGLKRMKKS